MADSIVETDTGDPLIAVCDYGQGRAMVWTTDVGPHWCPVTFAQWEGYGKLWRNAMHWLARKVTARSAFDFVQRKQADAEVSASVLRITAPCAKRGLCAALDILKPLHYNRFRSHAPIAQPDRASAS